MLAWLSASPPWTCSAGCSSTASTVRIYHCSQRIATDEHKPDTTHLTQPFVARYIRSIQVRSVPNPCRSPKCMSPASGIRSLQELSKNLPVQVHDSRIDHERVVEACGVTCSLARQGQQPASQWLVQPAHAAQHGYWQMGQICSSQRKVMFMRSNMHWSNDTLTFPQWAITHFLTTDSMNHCQHICHFDQWMLISCLGLRSRVAGLHLYARVLTSLRSPAMPSVIRASWVTFRAAASLV